MTSHDLVIRHGLICDGSGREAFVGDIAVDGDRIVAVGRVEGTGVEEIDASGQIVTPGFVDIHTHYDGQITWENRLAPSSGHGVTTVVMGNCGVGFAPCRQDDRSTLIKLMEGVEDIPEVVMAEGVPWNWETFPDYLDALSQRQSDIDFAAQLPHSPLRVFAMGERGVNLEPATEDDLANMRGLVTEAIRAGALGVTTSRIHAHSFRDGRLAPSVTAATRELAELAKGLRDAGSGVFQLVPDLHRSPEELLEELRLIADESGRPVSFTFVETPNHPGAAKKILAGLDQAAKDGLELRGQVIPRPTGILLGLDLSLNPFSFNPSFRTIEHLPLDQKVTAMRDPELRARILAEQPSDPHPFFMDVIREKGRLFDLGDPPNYHPDESESIAARAAEQGMNPLDLIYDTLLARDGHAILYRPMGNLVGERFEEVGRTLLHSPRTVLGLGDGGAHYGMICDAAYPSYFLTHWVRDRDDEARLELPDAVRMLSAEPAEAVGLRDRGRLAAGYKADINVIDMDRLRLYPPEPRFDLPKGGRRLIQRADGFTATIVSGTLVYANGVASGALPGRLQRGARPAPAAHA